MMSTQAEEVQKLEVLKHSMMINTYPEGAQKVEELKHYDSHEESTTKDQHFSMESEERASELEEEQEKDVDSGRERLKRHRFEMAGRVWIPDIWGQERLLKDWIDCAAFDRSLVPSGLVSARAALVQECRRRSSGAGIVRI